MVQKIKVANPEVKLSFFKKLQMRYNLWKEDFTIFKRTNKWVKFIKEFLEDMVVYGICGFLVSLPFFSLNPFTIALAVSGGLFLYVKRLHVLLIQIISNFKLVQVNNK